MGYELAFIGIVKDIEVFKGLDFAKLNNSSDAYPISKFTLRNLTDKQVPKLRMFPNLTKNVVELQSNILQRVYICGFPNRF